MPQRNSGVAVHPWPSSQLRTEAGGSSVSAPVTRGRRHIGISRDLGICRNSQAAWHHLISGNETPHGDPGLRAADDERRRAATYRTGIDRLDTRYPDVARESIEQVVCSAHRHFGNGEARDYRWLNRAAARPAISPGSTDTTGPGTRR
ncbi:three-helix bundle dimerization domain-containing protein [Rhodococcus sp. NPDC127530]|uniref:three-helix bundle dimerization domain-containing protein n=1 Tax=unclassified Rhodococcus (in: high G+C Gram-positive bacteria) TaxID=192944 RepID=UPI00362CA58A